MTEEEMKLIADAATKAATEAFEKSAKEQNVKITADYSKLENSIAEVGKKLDDAEAFAKTIDGKLVKVARSMGGVSLVDDLGAGKDELNLNKAKMYRGMLTENWAGADKEKEIAFAVREKAMQSDVGSSGGYAIPTEFNGSLMSYVRDFNPFTTMGLMLLNPTRSKLEIPGISSGTTAYMIGEGKEITESEMTFNLKTMTPHKVASLVYASQEMINAADPAIVGILERDTGEAIAAQQAFQILYGNKTGNGILGLYNIDGVQNYAPTADTTGTDPTRANLRAIRSMVAQKYMSNSFAFVGNENLFQKVVSLVETANTNGTLMGTDEEVIARAMGKKYFSTGHVLANKTLSTGHDLSDLFYGKWDEAMLATWWGGLRIESTNTGGKAWANGLIGFRAMLPFDFTVRRPETFVRAPYMKTINS